MTTFSERLASTTDLAGLKSLIMELSAAATKPNAILYSGMLDSFHSGITVTVHSIDIWSDCIHP
jgi:hypothetical protein